VPVQGSQHGIRDVVEQDKLMRYPIVQAYVRQQILNALADHADHTDHRPTFDASMISHLGIDITQQPMVLASLDCRDKKNKLATWYLLHFLGYQFRSE
jgi:DMSO/TMAO reductase YedYZ heme-binding membrane subunit